MLCISFSRKTPTAGGRVPQTTALCQARMPKNNACSSALIRFESAFVLLTNYTHKTLLPKKLLPVGIQM